MEAFSQQSPFSQMVQIVSIDIKLAGVVRMPTTVPEWNEDT